MQQGSDGKSIQEPSGKSPEETEKNPAAQADPGGSGPAEKLFPIVGIGASAGGLRALEEFFSELPEDSGIAFVVISHTDPAQVSMLPDILRRKTKTPVLLIEDGMNPVPDSIYLPPSDKDLLILKGGFHLIERKKTGGLHMPIDNFLKSLSEERGEHCGCVILSGTGTDGTHGLCSIKENGGITVAQSIDSAQYSGMPKSAIATCMVDFEMPPSEIAARLIRYFRFDRSRDAGSEEEIRALLTKILLFISRRTKHDFSLYKKSTLIRRTEQRMKITGCKNGSEYWSYLRNNPEETDLLFNNFLIGVTSFFRDPEAFDYLQKDVLPGLISRLPEGEALRVWIPGCSTGEEAYSVSIIISEVMAATGLRRDVQIFATDIDKHAIEKAREGVYLQNVSADITPERLSRFFIKEGQFYRVRKEIREPVIFAEQNVLGNPPFSRLDLLVCRNLLIYLEGEAQKKLIPLFHYTLRPGGALFLGTSESIGHFSHLFSAVHKKWSIYRKQDTVAAPVVRFPIAGRAVAEASRQSLVMEQKPERPGLGKAAESLLLREHVRPCVIVDRSENVLYVHGRTGKYLEPAEGEVRNRITDMAREGLNVPLSAALHDAYLSGREVRRRSIPVRTNGGYQNIDFSVTPVKEPPVLKDTFLIFFEEVALEGKPDDKRTVEGDNQNVALERELARARDDYQGALEELKSVNEEIQSSNEELQSSNEELESSREELQSLNEELSTVNAELHTKIEELSDAYNTIADVLNSTRIAIVFLDRKLRIKRFTDGAGPIMNLIQTDIGRPVHHIAPNFDYENLAQRIRGVIEKLDAFEEAIRTGDGHWYDMRIMPYRTRNDKLEGAVLTFVNIDSLKAGETRIEEFESRERSARGE